MSNVKMSIEDKKYLYEQPWFYNNKLALRCELGVGNGMKYLKNAKQRALEIFNILFNNEVPDCSFFHEYIYNDYNFDYSDFIKDINWSLELDIKDLRNDYCNEDLISIKRHITFNFDIKNIKKRIRKQIKSHKDPLFHFVSFENEFIFSIYDDRGCDIVFFSEEKYKEFYYKLEKYFLDYDRDRMKNTLNLIN